MKIITTLILAAAILFIAGTASAQSGNFRFTVNGFTCNMPTADDPADADGAKDEVFLFFHGEKIAGPWVPFATRQSKTIGDTSSFPARKPGGSASGAGGFQMGDSYPGQSPWLRTVPPDDRYLASRGWDGPAILPDLEIPFIIWEGKLTGGSDAVYMMPSIWEEDLTDSFFYNYGTAWYNSAWAIRSSPSLAGFVASGSGPDPGIFAAAIKAAFRPAPVLSNDNVHSRPVGMQSEGSKMYFAPQGLIFTYDAAERVASTDYGYGVGVFPVTYADSLGLSGNYTIFIHVERY